MLRREIVLLGLVAGPPLALAGLGLAHPTGLNPMSAARWRDLHVYLLPIFPLLGLAPWLLVRGEGRALRWTAAVLGYLYAAFYTALDVLAGIGAGALQQANLRPAASVVFAQADDLVRYGVWAYLAAAVLASGVGLRRSGLAALPGSALVIGGAWSFRHSHIFWPRGVLTMLVLALGWTALVLAQRAQSGQRAQLAQRARPVPPEVSPG
jgi:hypothetical protein